MVKKTDAEIIADTRARLDVVATELRRVARIVKRAGAPYTAEKLRREASQIARVYIGVRVELHTFKGDDARRARRLTAFWWHALAELVQAPEARDYDFEHARWPA